MLAVNIAGSALLGALLAEEPSRPRLRTLLHDAGAIGFCGGLTTFSTFAVEVADLAREGDGAIAALYTLGSVAGAVVGVVAGAAAVGRAHAAAAPLEEDV